MHHDWRFCVLYGRLQCVASEQRLDVEHARDFGHFRTRVLERREADAALPTTLCDRRHRSSGGGKSPGVEIVVRCTHYDRGGRGRRRRPAWQQIPSARDVADSMPIEKELVSQLERLEWKSCQIAVRRDHD